MVARNTAPFISAAIASARAQTFRDIEIVVLDDGSTDETRAIAEAHARDDDRVRVLDGPGAGLAAIRNASLAAARGTYAAILDSDDLLEPDHIATLLGAAQASDAQMVAANMITFSMEDGVRQQGVFAPGAAWAQSREIELTQFIRANCIYGKGTSLGYLKPMFHMNFLRNQKLSYDPSLRIGEDYDLVMRALLAGGRYLYVPNTSYHYRRHAGSTSARLPLADIEALLMAERRHVWPDNGPVRAAARARMRSLIMARCHARAVLALKAHRPMAAVWALGLSGASWRLMLRSLYETAMRRSSGGLAQGARA